jgi:hypothetical protein
MEMVEEMVVEEVAADSNCSLELSNHLQDQDKLRCMLTPFTNFFTTLLFAVVCFSIVGEHILLFC